MNLILLGAPGAGKGTQAEVISDALGIPQISTGNILREAVKNGTEYGLKAKAAMDSGSLVSDDVVIGILKDRIAEDDCKNGFILDGFPRTVAQAEALQEFLVSRNENLDTALCIEVPSSFILERMTGRRVCLSCGASYHVKFNPPSVEGVCDVCGDNVIQRKDDVEETVKERLDVYERQTQPLIDFYKEKNLLSTVDATKAINEVFESICNILGSAN